MPNVFADLVAALRLMTAIPLPPPRRERGAAQATWAYPVAGAVVGFVVAAIAVAATTLPAAMGVFLIVAAWAAVTGGLHLDGVADVGDAGLAPRSPHERHAILNDPRLGSFGALALIAVLAAKAVAVAEGPPPALLLVAAITPRALLPTAMRCFKPHAGSRMAAAARPGTAAASLALALGAVLLVLLALWLDLEPSRLAVALAASAATVAVVLAWCRAKFAGIGGDALGAAVELGEVALLWAWLVV